MTNTIGRVNFTATLDGRYMKRDAERVGRQAGAAASEGYDESWSKGFSNTLTKAGKEAFKRWEAQGKKDGGVYTAGLSDRFNRFIKQANLNFQSLRLDPTFLDDWTKKFEKAGDDAGIALGELQQQMVELNRQGTISDQVFAAVRKQIDDYAASSKAAAIETNRLADAQESAAIEDDRRKRAIADLKVDLRDASAAYKVVATEIEKNERLVSKNTETVKKNTDEVKRNTSGLNDHGKMLSHNGRQFLFWTAAIAAGGEQIATLGSAAGAGLLVVAGAAAQAVTGIGATIAVFHDLGGELEELPAAVRPAAEAFQSIGDALGALQDRLQTNALDNATEDFERIRDAVEALAPAFDPLADVIGGLIRSFSEWADVASQPGGELFKFIENSAPTFESLMRSVGTLGDALLKAFNNPAMLNAIEGFTGWIEDLVTAFDDFVTGPTFDDWIGNGVAILKSFGGLLEAVAETLANIVTPETVERTVRFLDNLAESMPFFEAIISLLGELDVFGLIAQVFNDVGNALVPFLEHLTPIAEILNVLVTIISGSLAFALQLLTPLLLPLQLGFQFLGEVVEQVGIWFEAVRPSLELLGDALVTASEQILAAFNPAIEAIGDAIQAMLPSPEEFERFITEDLVPAIEDISNWIVEQLVPAIQDFAHWVETDAIPAIEDFVRWFNEELGPIIEDVVTWFRDDLGPVIQDVATWLGDSEGDWRAWGDVVGGVLYALLNPIGAVIDGINNVLALIRQANNAQIVGRAGTASGGGFSRPLARGGLVTAPERRLIAEAGPELVVPLRRPTSQVDPVVRGLSALLQGAIGGGGGGVQPGAIVVQEAGDARRTAYEVLDVISNNLGG